MIVLPGIDGRIAVQPTPKSLIGDSNMVKRRKGGDTASNPVRDFLRSLNRKAKVFVTLLWDVWTLSMHVASLCFETGEVESLVMS